MVSIEYFQWFFALIPARWMNRSMSFIIIKFCLLNKMLNEHDTQKISSSNNNNNVETNGTGRAIQLNEHHQFINTTGFNHAKKSFLFVMISFITKAIETIAQSLMLQL